MGPGTELNSEPGCPVICSIHRVDDVLLRPFKIDCVFCISSHVQFPRNRSKTHHINFFKVCVNFSRSSCARASNFQNQLMQNTHSILNGLMSDE